MLCVQSWENACRWIGGLPWSVVVVVHMVQVRVVQEMMWMLSV